MPDITSDQPSLDPFQAGTGISTTSCADDLHTEPSADANIATDGILEYGVPKVATLTYFTQGAGIAPAYVNSPHGPQQILQSGIARFAKPTYGDTVANDEASMKLVNDFDRETLQPAIHGKLNRPGIVPSDFQGPEGESVVDFLRRANNVYMSASTQAVENTVLSLYGHNAILIPEDQIKSFHHAADTLEEYYQSPPIADSRYIVDYKDLETLDEENEMRWKGWKIGPGEIFEEVRRGQIYHYVPSIIPPNETIHSASTTGGDAPLVTSDSADTTGCGSEGDEVRRLGALTLDDCQARPKAV